MPTPTSHALLSASAAERWLNCTPAPRLEEGIEEQTSSYAAEGRLAHAISELAARKKFCGLSTRSYNSKLKKLKADPSYDKEMLDHAEGYVDHLAQVAMGFAHQPHTALEVRVDYSDYAPEGFGTCDCVMIGSDLLVIADYKYGKGVPVAAERNPQMMLYALGALKFYWPIYGDSIKTVRLRIDQPRLDALDTWDVAVKDLKDWGETYVKPKAQLAFAGLGNACPGDWCRWCRAKALCPARAGAATALEDFKDCVPAGKAESVKPGLRLLTNAEVGDLLTRGKNLVAWYKDLQDYALSACLAGDEIPGWKAVEGRSVRAFNDAEAAIKAVLDAGYKRALVYDQVPKSLAQLEKLLGKADFDKLLGKRVIKPPGKPALVKESDKRPAVTAAAKDFTGLEAPTTDKE